MQWCIVLFVSTVLVLEITPNMNSYVLKQTIPTEGITVQKAEGKATLYLCTVNGTKHLSMNISSNDELQRWLESFAMCPKLVIDDSCCSSISPVQPQKIEMGSVRSVVVNGTKHLSMNISSNDELQRWLESFAMCPKLVIDDSCCSSISPVQPQKIEMGSVRSVVGYLI
uniref:PH domain-containing protein n=1 Tax=Ascaris lumbricoides TaxID=6252 RepID=A0A0M3IM17_ASCLU